MFMDLEPAEIRPQMRRIWHACSMQGDRELLAFMEETANKISNAARQRREDLDRSRYLKGISDYAGVPQAARARHRLFASPAAAGRMKNTDRITPSSTRSTKASPAHSKALRFFGSRCGACSAR